jgi:hypothetical protein
MDKNLQVSCTALHLRQIQTLNVWLDAATDALGEQTWRPSGIMTAISSCSIDV